MYSKITRFLIFSLVCCGINFVSTQQDSTQLKGTVILFITTKEDSPSGQYWKVNEVKTDRGYVVNPSSVLIEDDNWYSDIIESSVELYDERANYLGYFIDYQSGQPRYLYGTLDTKIVGDDDSDDSDDSDDGE